MVSLNKVLLLYKTANKLPGLLFFVLQVTSGFELYAAFSPLVTKPDAINAINKLLRWIKVWYLDFGNCKNTLLHISQTGFYHFYISTDISTRHIISLLILERFWISYFRLMPWRNEVWLSRFVVCFIVLVIIYHQIAECTKSLYLFLLLLLFSAWGRQAVYFELPSVLNILSLPPSNVSLDTDTVECWVYHAALKASKKQD